MAYPHPIIAREGWAILAGAVAISALATVGLARALGPAGLAQSLPFWIFTAFALQFFRDPARPVPTEPNAVLSPVDGRVVKIEPAKDPYTGRDALQISVFMNVFNVHCQKSPVAGTVVKREYHAGKYLNAALDKASEENERNALVIRMDDGRLLTVVQVAGLVARRILCHVDEGETLGRGQRYGFIRFGSRADLYLPPNSRVRVAIGDKVRAPTTVLATLEPESQA